MAEQRETTLSSITTPVTDGRESISCDVPPATHYRVLSTVCVPGSRHCRGGGDVETARQSLPSGASQGLYVIGRHISGALVPSTLELRLQSLSYLVTFPKFPGHLHEVSMQAAAAP